MGIGLYNSLCQTPYFVLSPSHNSWLRDVLTHIELEKVKFLPLSSGNIFNKTWQPFIEYLDRSRPTIHPESGQKQTPSDIKEKDRIKGSTCCVFDLQLGPAAPLQTSCYLTPRWEGWTRQRKDDQSHSDPPWDSRLVWVNAWVLLGGPCGRAAPFPLSGLWKRNPQWKTRYCGSGLPSFWRKNKSHEYLQKHLWTLIEPLWEQYGVSNGNMGSEGDQCELPVRLNLH